MIGRSLRRMAGPSVALLVVAALVAGAIPPVTPKAASASPGVREFDSRCPPVRTRRQRPLSRSCVARRVHGSRPRFVMHDHRATLDVQPDEGWRVDLDACASTPTPDEATYTWSFADTGEPLNVLPGDAPCKFVTYFPDEGSFNIKLFVVKPGESSTRIETVRVQDWLIVSMGDSLGAGEGARTGTPRKAGSRCGKTAAAIVPRRQGRPRRRSCSSSSIPGRR